METGIVELKRLPSGLIVYVQTVQRNVALIASRAGDGPFLVHAGLESHQIGCIQAELDR